MDGTALLIIMDTEHGLRSSEGASSPAVSSSRKEPQDSIIFEKKTGNKHFGLKHLRTQDLLGCRSLQPLDLPNSPYSPAHCLAKQFSAPGSPAFASASPLSVTPKSNNGEGPQRTDSPPASRGFDDLKLPFGRSRRLLTKVALPPRVRTSELPPELLERYQLKETRRLKRIPDATALPAKNKLTGREVTIRIITKDVQSSLEVFRLKKRLQVLKRVKHARIIQLVDLFECDANIYPVNESTDVYVDSLSSFLQSEKYCNGFEEPQAYAIFSQLVAAVGCLHELSIVHGKLSPSDILFVDDTMASIKISILGLTGVCNQVGFEGLQYEFTAPEIIRSKNVHENSKQVDMWSLGVILYILLCGKSPFIGIDPDDTTSLIENVRKGFFTLDREPWGNVSAGAKHLLQNLLVVNPNDRFNIEDCQVHGWMFQGQELEGQASLGLSVEACSPSFKSRLPPSAPSTPTLKRLTICREAFNLA